MAKSKTEPDWLGELATDACPDCGKACVRVLNRDSGKTGLLDPRSAVLVGFEPHNRKRFIDGNTGRDFLARVDHFRFPDNTTIAPAQVRFLAAHKFTCAKRPRVAVPTTSLGIGGWVEPLIEGVCRQEKCFTPLLWIRNLQTSNPVPCDARAPVYVVFQPAAGFMASATIEAALSTTWLKSIDRIVLHGGVDFSSARLHFFVSHFATCTNPDEFRKPYGGKR